MSTVPEVIVARHMGMNVLGLSVVTDMCLPDALEPGDHRVILKAAQSAEPKLTKIVKEVLKNHPEVQYEEADALERQDEAFGMGVSSVPAITIDGELWKCGIPSKKEVEAEIARRIKK